MYRKEIDGLRAIAILAVLIYHAQISVLDTRVLVSGYLGVDIFFVISGYLIGKILMIEMDRTGRISFLRFYERRARRILPALIGVSLASLVAAWFYLLPEDFVDFSASVIASFLFVSNIFFYVETTEYSADTALLEPFLHTWSLSVEEQFYLIFPLVMLALFRWQRQRILAGFLILSAISFVFAAIYTRLDPDLSFYLPFSRIWEMLAGAIVARLELRRSRWLAIGWARRWLPLVGCVLILVPVFVALPAHAHPGPATIVPVLGTALVLAYGSTGGAVGAVLASRPMIVIGLLSYSLYLWHFPIFAFGRMSAVDPGLSDKVVWILAAIVMSVVSYAIIEQPFRNRAVIGGRVFGSSLGIAMLAVFMSNSAVLVSDGFSDRVPSALRPYDGPIGYRSLTDGTRRCHNHPDDICRLEIDDASDVTVVLTGDSHADTLSDDLFAKLRELKIGSYVHMTSSGCPVILGFTVDGRRHCSTDRQQKRMDLIDEISARSKTIVIYFARTPVYLTGTRYDGGPGRVEGGPPFKHVIDGDRTENLVKTLDRISHSADLIIVYPMPELGIHAQRYFLDRIRPVAPGKLERVMSQSPLGIPEEMFLERAASSLAALNSVNIPPSQRVYPHHLLCNTVETGWCAAHDNSQLFYTDSNHPNWILADRINDQIVRSVEAILARTNPVKN